ncbi:CYTH domain-containing protein [Gilvimarinus sp. SDUM040013]|uniref:CYTH domain-containing protein n=1 Tax=Gilvimarinus gilvus TaxID=3058038 RepID=A0ABU4S1F6_9GAMM|nr:CYTH domain-containing protein [Gilvimarinus sp. SDUM040013]MDO3384817.1 CYTH domain-containing protein [Gilvimarinus sp. SDUM040013]MDX6850850.1 CYTH domain-containing protein [Gilvimarinus sp. SDUM040013]
MGIEIERKFLVDVSLLPELVAGTYISQGYVETASSTVVRIRVKGNIGYLTLKGESTGIACAEYEYEIPKADAKEIIATLCAGKTVEKTRYEYPVANHTWEVDIFHGENQGLIVAEIELGAENEEFLKPDWVMEEVTGQTRYFNSQLLNHPYATW